MSRRLGPLLFFAAVTVLAFWKVIFHSEFTLLTGGDMATAYFPWFDVAAYWLKRGVFLLWDPYVYSGKPNMGEPQPGIFYPLNWVFMMLPARNGGVNPGAIQVLIILDYFLAAVFTYRLARSLHLSVRGSALAGIAFAFGGFMAALYGYINVLSGFVWMPLALYFHRRSLVSTGWRPRVPPLIATGACLAATFLPGHHAPLIHTGFLLLLFTLFFIVSENPAWLRPAAYGPFLVLGMSTAIAFALTAFQWLPSALWARQVFRWVGAGDALRWGQRVPYSVLEQTSNLAPQDALSLVLPYLSTNVNLYTGCIVLFFALVGLLFVRQREATFFGVLAIGYFLLSLGRFSALHGWVNSIVPGLWFARELFFYLVPMQLCVALLAGWGLDKTCAVFAGSRPDGLGIFLKRTAWALSAIALFAGAFVSVLAYGRGLPMNHPFVMGLGGLTAWVVILGVLLFLGHTGRISSTTFGALVLIAALLDLSSRVSLDVRLKSPPQEQENTYVRSFWKMPPTAERLRRMRQNEVFRIDDPSGIFPPNYGDAWRLDATMGHGATALVDYFALRGTGWGPASNASALLNVAYFPSRVPTAGMELVPGEGEPIYRNPRAAARAFVPARFRCFENRDDMLRWLGSPLFAPRDVVLLDRSAFGQLPVEFRDTRYDDEEPIELNLVHCRRGTDDHIESLSGSKRHEAQTYQAAFGWGKGDQAVLQVRPKTGGLRWFAAFVYRHRAGQPPAQLRLSLTGATDSRTIVTDLPAGDGWLEAVADLGQLECREYRMSFVKGDDCGALLDSFRVTRSADPQPSPGSVSVSSRKPNRVQLRARLARPSFVVLSEVYYPGWMAYVDGKPAPLLRGDYILRTVPVPAGDHAIELRFRPAPFRWALVVSMGFLALAIVVSWRARLHGSGRRSNST